MTVIFSTNCHKTILFRPLSQLSKVFLSPADDTYAWLNVPDADIALLNDFRWSRKLLLFLERQPVHFIKQKKKNVATIGILTVSTLKCRTQYDRKVKTNDMENEMMVAL